MTSVRPELSVKIYTPRLLPSSALQVQWSDDDTAALSNLRQILKALLALQSQLIRDESALQISTTLRTHHYSAASHGP